MANMSYCRFQNTLADLRDCRQALDDEGGTSLDERLSEDEYRAFKRLVKLCRQIADDYEGVD